MNKRNTVKKPRIVERGAGWYITYDPMTLDYSAYYDDNEYIGSRATKEDAYYAIWENFDRNAAEDRALQSHAAEVEANAAARMGLMIGRAA